MARVVLMAILRAYRLVISPLYGQTCRYYPSCSAYALGAVDTLGALRGTWLAMRRLARCHPWCAGGVDLVPTAEHYRWWGRGLGTDGDDDPEESDTPNESYPADDLPPTNLPNEHLPYETPAPHAPVSDAPVARGA